MKKFIALPLLLLLIYSCKKNGHPADRDQSLHNRSKDYVHHFIQGDWKLEFRWTGAGDTLHEMIDDVWKIHGDRFEEVRAGSLVWSDSIGLDTATYQGHQVYTMMDLYIIDRYENGYLVLTELTPEIYSWYFRKVGN